MAAANMAKNSPPADSELGGAPVLIEKADVLDAEAPEVSSSPLESIKWQIENRMAPLMVPQTMEHLDVPPAIDPVTMMPMEGSFGGDAWDAENAIKDIGQVTANVQELGTKVVDMASTAGKEAAAAVQELGTKMTGLTTISTTLTSWWSSFDPMGEKTYQQQESTQLIGPPQPAPTSGASPAVQVSSRDKDTTGINLQALFGLPPEESLIEAFSCALLQSYRCMHNSFTPELPLCFAGTLCITDTHVCFHVDDGERRIPIKLEHSSLKNVSRQRARRGETGDTLKLHLGADQWLAVRGFARAEDMESAQALLEHLCT